MEILLSYELESFHVHVKRFAPAHHCQWPEYVPGRLCVFLDGSMHEKDDRFTVSDVVYKPPDDRPSLRFGERGARTLTVELQHSGLDVLRSGGFDIGEPFSVHSMPCFSVAERLRHELADGDEMTPLVMEGLVLDLFTRSHRSRHREPNSGVPGWLEAVRARIETDFVESQTLRDYARDAGVHPMELATSYRRHYQTSVGEHIRALRVRRAMEALSRTRKTIADIAVESGFSDQSHLTRVFKRHTGSTPARFRHEC